jgi:hypothetical protein
VGSNRGSRVFAAISAAALIFAPVAHADGQSPSYSLGKQSIDDVFNRYGITGLTGGNGLQAYCPSLLEQLVKSGTIRQLDSRSDFIAGCVDEGQALLASH